MLSAMIFRISALSVVEFGKFERFERFTCRLMNNGPIFVPYNTIHVKVRYSYPLQ